VAGGGPVHALSLAEWQRVQDINLTGTFLSARAVLPAMIDQRAGSIVTIASVEGLEGCEGGSTYNASKGGVVLLTKNIASDYGLLGIRANAICPGFIDTPMFQAVLGSDAATEIREATRRQHKLGRFGRPEEIAGAALFLASDDASFVTGVALPVDGGYTAGHSYGVAAALGLT
jgi:NAD(P)-dependent dehydrogenase (short-subunit alcohol dehydrogenase family)